MCRRCAGPAPLHLTSETIVRRTHADRQRLHRLAQRRDVDRRNDARGKGDVVGGAFRGLLMHEPERALAERQRAASPSSARPRHASAQGRRPRRAISSARCSAVRAPFGAAEPQSIAFEPQLDALRRQRPYQFRHAHSEPSSHASADATRSSPDCGHVDRSRSSDLPTIDRRSALAGIRSSAEPHTGRSRSGS